MNPDATSPDAPASAPERAPATALQQRRSGVLLHPTSLPGPHGSGDLGPHARYFVDWLHSAAQGWWQTLPLSPTGPGNSPYMGASALAGNPQLIALEPLAELGWLRLPDAPPPSPRVDFDTVSPWRMAALRAAWAGFAEHAGAAQRSAWQSWCESAGPWLDDYALFMALDAAHAGAPWPTWSAGLARRDARALRAARRQHASEIDFWRFVQWQFDQQWQSLRLYAGARGVALMGDLPIYVAHHSADCWAHAHLFELDAQGWPLAVAGVPPDYFSPTGQHWGNPLYAWAAMARENYAWWVQRLRRALALYDAVRVDHFRGFADYWAIPADAPDASAGAWRSGPGRAPFDALRTQLGALPLVAEDLGIVTDAVHQLRRELGLPGMRVLQFAFGEQPNHPFLPHQHSPDSVVYTGTHDNDTTRGWWASTSATVRDHARRYLGCNDDEIGWALIRVAAFSVANTAVIPFQDVLGLDAAHRMNTPGQLGCWSWRFNWNWVGPQPAQRLAEITHLAGRAPQG